MKIIFGGDAKSEGPNHSAQSTTRNRIISTDTPQYLGKENALYQIPDSIGLKCRNRSRRRSENRQDFRRSAHNAETLGEFRYTKRPEIPMLIHGVNGSMYQ
jgi:hypothetical protein